MLNAGQWLAGHHIRVWKPARTKKDMYGSQDTGPAVSANANHPKRGHQATKSAPTSEFREMSGVRDRPTSRIRATEAGALRNRSTMRLSLAVAIIDKGDADKLQRYRLVRHLHERGRMFADRIIGVRC